MKSKYIKLRIFQSEKRVHYSRFSIDIEAKKAKKAAELTGVSRPTVNKFYKAIHEQNAELC